MPKHALSNTLKRRISRADEEERIAKGVAKYREEMASEGGPKSSLRAIANEFGIKSWSTLRNRINGKQSMATFNESKQFLTPAEEEKVVELLLASSDRSRPFDYNNIARLANTILAARLGDSFTKVGKNWVSRFVERHHAKLQTYWSKPLDSQRAKCLNPEAVRNWFAIVKVEIAEKNIAPENIYGMDESGFPPSNQGTSRVVGRRGMKIQHKQGTANRENVTAIVTICADGTHLNPLIIFKGKHLKKCWIDPVRNVSKAELVFLSINTHKYSNSFDM